MDAAIRGGFKVIEFTMTIPGALELIKEYARKDGLVVGAGTVLTIEQARSALEFSVITNALRFITLKYNCYKLFFNSSNIK